MKARQVLALAILREAGAESAVVRSGTRSAGASLVRSRLMKTVARLLAWLLFACLARITGRARYAWMAHYLSRKGGVLSANQYAPGLGIDGLAPGAYWGTNLVLSTSYREHGFYGRPELFYLVGGFHFSVEELSDGVRISAEDVYNWHPMRMENGEWGYFASPIPALPVEWVWPLNFFLGHTFFQESFDGEFAVSNYLWEWLEGEPFTTTIEWEFSTQEWEAALEAEKEEYDW